MKNKIIILGDSFAITRFEKEFNLENWPNVLYEEFQNEYDFYLDVKSGRDPITMIENYTKLIPNLNEKDIVIVFLSSFMRIRLPLDKNYHEKIDLGEFQIINRFICPSLYDKKINQLDLLDNTKNKEYYGETLSYQFYINGCESSVENYCEMIESLKKLSKNRNYFFCWDEIPFYKHIIMDKNDITNEIGIWETLADVYNQTKENENFEGDFHWSVKTHKLFGKYLIDKIKNE